MNKEQFSKTVDLAISDCEEFHLIDQMFLESTPNIYDISKQVEYFKDLKAQAQFHFKICNKKYCKLIYQHNKEKSKK